MATWPARHGMSGSISSPWRHRFWHQSRGCWTAQMNLILLEYIGNVGGQAEQAADRRTVAARFPGQHRPAHLSRYRPAARVARYWFVCDGSRHEFLGSSRRVSCTCSPKNCRSSASRDTVVRQIGCACRLLEKYALGEEGLPVMSQSTCCASQLPKFQKCPIIFIHALCLNSMDSCERRGPLARRCLRWRLMRASRHRFKEPPFRDGL